MQKTRTAFDTMHTDVQCGACGRPDIQPLRDLVDATGTLCRVCGEEIVFSEVDKARMAEERLGALMVETK